MKLATKLVSVFMLVILVLIALDAYGAIAHESERYETIRRRDLDRVGHYLQVMVVNSDGDYARTMEIIERINNHDPAYDLRWVWFDPSAAEHERPRPALRVAEMETDEDGVVHLPMERAEEERLLVAYVQVGLRGDRPGAVEVEATAPELTRLRHDLMIRGWQLAGIVFVCGVSFVFFSNRWMARPLTRLMEKTQRISRGDFSSPLTLRGQDELSSLARSLNDMCDDLAASQTRDAEATARRLEMVRQLRHVDRLHTVGRLAAGIAHEMGTPLTVISGRAEMIAAGRFGPSEVQSHARTIKEQADRIAGIISQTLRFARLDPADRTPVDVRTVIEQTLELLAALARKGRAETVVVAPPDPVIVHADAGQVQQVLTNLIVNATQAMPDGGTITIRVERSSERPPGDPHATPGPYVRIDIEDEGTGIAAENVDRVFDPFFTTKEVGEGTGMGLSVVYGIAQEHDGWVEVRSAEGRGSTFSVYLPEETGM